jgi:hypothetical protein
MHSNTSRFDRVMLSAIIVNTAILGWSWVDQAHALTLERVDTCFVVFFLIELVTRLRHGGRRWLRQPWNLFDATVILLALLPVVGDGITILRAARVAKLVHLGRHISHLRAAAWLGRRLNRPRSTASGSNRRRWCSIAHLTQNPHQEIISHSRRGGQSQHHVGTRATISAGFGWRRIGQLQQLEDGTCGRFFPALCGAV